VFVADLTMYSFFGIMFMSSYVVEDDNVDLFDELNRLQYNAGVSTSQHPS